MIENVLRKKGYGTEVLILVQPNSRTEGIAGIDEWRGRLLVRIKEKPVEGKANAVVVRFFSRLFSVSTKEVRITSGQKGREKTIQIDKAVLETQAVLKRALGID